MPTCPTGHRPASKRDGRDPAGGQRYACRACGHDFTEHSASAFSGYRWPPEVILTAVRWYLSHPLSATSVMVLLAKRGIDVSKRTVLRWVQPFGPLLAAEVRKHRRRPGRTWYVDEMFFFRDGGQEKRYCDCDEVQLKSNGRKQWRWHAVDQDGLVLDILVQERRTQEASATFLRRVVDGCGYQPRVVVTDKLASSPPALRRVLPPAAAPLAQRLA